jgi:hypothetical protein
LYGGDANNSPSSGAETISIEVVTGVKNIVTVSSYRLQSWGLSCGPALYTECFSIQQNFFLVNPSGALLFWVQNMVFVAKGPLGGTRAAADYNIWKFKADGSHTLVADRGSVSASWFMDIHLPTTFSLSSYISGGTILLSNSEYAPGFSYPIPAQSQIKASINSLQSEPQLVVVGETDPCYPVSSCSDTAVFLTQGILEGQTTKIIVSSFVQLENGPFVGWPYIAQSVINCATCGQLTTGETSQNLFLATYVLGYATFEDVAGGTAQGVAFTQGS